MADETRERDPSRPIHYEPDEEQEVSDIVGPMYPPWDQLEAWAAEDDYDHPVILWQVRPRDGERPRQPPRVLGRVLRARPPAGRIRLGLARPGAPPDHGGRRGSGSPTAATSATNRTTQTSTSTGWCSRTGRPSPGLTEYKKVIEPVTFEASDLDGGEVVVENRYDFRDLDHLRATWRVEADGELLESGAVDLPQTCRRRAHDADRSRRFRATGRRCREPPGHGRSRTRGRDQVGVGGPHRRDRAVRTARRRAVGAVPGASAPLSCETTDDGLLVSNAAFELTFDDTRGVVDSLSYQGREVVAGGPRAGLWRAPTDDNGLPSPGRCSPG